ncbi:tetratricopeptide repeat protein [Pleomorphomonas carboxyditropha]|uniref:Uncharacterized protein n=1 Tax=Pleomorphomonas carboxyditropha TaxID=2023338 RepID=A0A2G9WZX4_9HYPH|nr:hypothetical protein [Pleomorphomonas carboxyditropha]PIP00272.1 hypothetical protein CJ014_05940 [Pleomorphomonas carboxyditropha]
MESAGTVTLEILEGSGLFQHGEGYDDIADALAATLDARDGDQLTDAQYIAALKALVARKPDFIDGHAHLGFELLEQGKPKLALQACSRGFEIGERAIPAGFSGTIEWGFLENRPFLRAAHGKLLCHLRLGRRREALAIMEKLLRWNPDDNQGLRFLIGSEYLRLGDRVKAARFFRDAAPNYPPYYYEEGLLHLLQGDRIAAATSLRRGFVTIPYVAEMLCGHPDPLPLAIWHDSNLAEAETARAYFDLCAELWYKTSNAISFLHWLYNHPKVLAERARVMECNEALLWQHDPVQRRKLSKAREAAFAAIDDRLSEEIVVERADRKGRMIAPWRYAR